MSASTTTLSPQLHRLEAERIRASATRMLEKGFAEVARRFNDMAYSHELAADRMTRQEAMAACA